MLTIAIDYDGTLDRIGYALSPFVERCREAGWRVLVVSSRMCECTPDGKCENCSDLKAAAEYVGPVILTSGVAKKWFLEQRGIKVDIWIDDEPESILQGK